MLGQKTPGSQHPRSRASSSASRHALLMGGSRSTTKKTPSSGTSGRLNGVVAASMGDSDRFIPQRGGDAEQDLSSYQLKAAAQAALAGQTTPERVGAATKAAADAAAAAEGAGAGSGAGENVASAAATAAASAGAAARAGKAESTVPTPVKDEMKERLADGLFGEGGLDAKVLAYRQRAPVLDGSAAGTAAHPHAALHTFARAGPGGAAGRLAAGKVLGGDGIDAAAKKRGASRARTTRHIAPAPTKILDAPNFTPDYYLNLLDWGATDVVALGLDTVVYLWNSATAEIAELMDTGDAANKIASVRWDRSGKYLAVGLYDGTVQLWDADAKTKLRSLQHAEGVRVAALDWNEYLLTTGAKDGTLRVWDVRVQDALMAEVHDHAQEVCGIRWRDDGKQLATGGNDDTVYVYDFDIASPRDSLTQRHQLVGHQAAVKALAWCPWQRDLLSTGGGTTDRTVRFWNTTTGECKNHIDTGSQVSAIVWSRNPAVKEFVTSHGYATNALVVWKYPTLVRVAELVGHEERVLHMVPSPDGQMVVSASPEDESLRFWKIFDPAPPPDAAAGKVAAKARQATAASAGRRLGTTRSIR